MGYAVYERNGRDCGYGIPSLCDQPECSEKIDRGLAYLCGKDPGGDEFGCGLYFCSSHLLLDYPDGLEESSWRCDRCIAGEDPYDPKPDLLEWVHWKLTDESWQQWREENPVEVIALLSRV